MKPFEVLRVLDRDGNLLEENRAEPVDVIRADTAYVMTNLLRGVLVRGHGAASRQPRRRVAARRQDRHRRRQHRRLVHRLRSRHHRRRLDRVGRKEVARQPGAGRARGAADLDGIHEGLHRRQTRQGRSAAVRGAGQHRVPHSRQIERRRPLPGDPGWNLAKRSLPARSLVRTHSRDRSESLAGSCREAAQGARRLRYSQRQRGREEDDAVRHQDQNPGDQRIRRPQGGLDHPSDRSA